MYNSRQTLDPFFDPRRSQSAPFFTTWEPIANGQPIRVVSERALLQKPRREGDDQARPNLVWFGFLAFAIALSLLVLGFAAIELVDVLSGIGREVARYRFEAILQGISGR